MAVALETTRTGRELLGYDPKLFARLAHSVTREHNVSLPYAERVVDQALAFLATTADHVGAPLGPSRVVDWGWHAFILRTHDYARFRGTDDEVE